MKKWYHGSTGFWHEKKTTALDVVNFEKNEYGNTIELLVSEEELQKIRASTTLWVTQNKSYAKNFGPVHEATVEKLLAYDGDGGYLAIAY